MTLPRILVNDISPTPDRLTGLSIYTWAILGALIRSGRFEYVLATNRAAQHIPDHIKAGVVETIYRTVPVNEALALIANTRALPRLARTHDCAALFHPTPTAILRKGHNSAVVVHDLYRVTHPQLFRWTKRWQWHLLIARAFHAAGALIAVSNATREAFLASYPRLHDRLSVVHEASTLDPKLEPVAENPIAGRYGLVVANVSPNKNIGQLIGALQHLASQGQRPHIVIAGRDDDNILRDGLARAPEVNITSLGSVSEAVLQRLYCDAHAYINTSLVEGFCLPILEAQQSRVPVICSDLPVLHEVAGAGALFVDPGDPLALADAIQCLWADTAMHADLVARAAENESHFSWEKAARETEDVLAQLIAQSRR